VWADDGRTLAYIVEGADTVVQTIRADGSDMGASEVLLDRDRGVWEIGFTPEGEGILFREGEGGAEGTEVWYLSLDPDSTPERQLATGYYDRSVVLSPDGRWMAYVSDFSGQDQVFLRRFRSADPGLIQISTNGGTEPVWAHNGRELFFRDLSDGNLVSASLSAGPEMRVEGRTVLFDASEYVTQANWQRYDVSGDDQRFLFIRPLSAEIENFALVLVQDFSSELQNLVGEGR
jgi:Tol biopolymer transport system component